MMLIEETAVPDAALPVGLLKDHLRLGTGFSDVGMQDALLAGHLRAALGVIEARTGKALMARRFRLELPCWRGTAGQALPVAPVVAVLSVTLRDAAGAGVVLAPAGWRLMTDMHRPRLVPLGTALPVVPEGGKAEVVFEAGFGSDWAAVPADLAQAVLLLAAELYERRHEGGTPSPGLPFGVQVLIERWRTVRVLGGGR